MKKIKVKFVQQNVILDRYLITDKEGIAQYKIRFADQYPFVRDVFETEVMNGNKIIVHDNGSWCSEAKGFVEIV